MQKTPQYGQQCNYFDEAQMLPVDYLKPCIAAMEELIDRYGSSVVLCTATQPALQSLFQRREMQ